MAELAVGLTFPAAPITSLQKRIAKGIEQLYYAKLFLTAPGYADGAVWRGWHERGFHVAIFSPPAGTAAGDRVRVRVQAPSATPHVSVIGDNLGAVQDLAVLLRAVDATRPSVAGTGSAQRAAALREGDVGRAVVQPLIETLTRLGFSEAEIADYVAMLQRGFDALTDDTIAAIDVSVS